MTIPFRIITLTILFLGFSYQVLSQYHPLIASGKVWREMVESDNGLWFLDEYMLTSDTTIDNTIYKKLEMVSSTDSGVNLPFYAAAIREDIIEKKVYIRYPADTVERVLYNFNLLAGEQHLFHHCYYLAPIPSNPVYANVDSIGTYVDEYGFTRKVWYLDMSHWGVQTRIVEGVGSNTGLISYSCHFNVWNDLICVHDSSETYFINDLPFANYCTPYVNADITELKPTTGLVNIYPNPSNGEFVLNGFTEELEQVSIYSLSGKLLFSKDKVPVNEKLNVDLPSGIYLVKSSFKNQEFVNRLFIKK